LSINLNRANLASSDFNITMNQIMDNACVAAQRDKREARGERKNSLGASTIGSECLRQVQYTWKVDVDFDARKKRIFARGFAFEDIIADEMSKAGFRIERNTDALKFATMDDEFRGLGDGIIHAGPVQIAYPTLWECKALKAATWRKIEREGLRKAHFAYYMQVQLYQGYLGLDNPALFTVVNSDTCEVLFLLVPFDAEVAQASSDKAVSVVKATRAGELLPRISNDPTHWLCKVCDHKERCWAQE
jgi:hypothetical protein